MPPRRRPGLVRWGVASPHRGMRPPPSSDVFAGSWDFSYRRVPGPPKRPPGPPQWHVHVSSWAGRRAFAAAGRGSGAVRAIALRGGSNSPVQALTSAALTSSSACVLVIALGPVAPVVLQVLE